MSSTTATPRPTSGTARGTGGDRPAPRRSLPFLACSAGLVAALGPLLVCVALGVVGWFLSDSGVHGAPRDGMGTGAVVWLTAHGSTAEVQGTVLTMLPLGLTLVCVWAVWRTSLRLGTQVAGHGPDADGITDGERDWTVPASTFFAGASYLVVAVLVSSVAGAPAAVSTPRVVVAVLLLALLVQAPAIAVGSGRAAVWASRWPVVVPTTLAAARRVLLWFLAASALLALVRLVLDWGDAATTLSQLHSSAGEAALIVGLCLLLAPNAVLYGSSWLLGPGFAVGTGTIVAPTVVTVGPLPLFPLAAVVPTQAPGEWASWLVVVPGIVAALAVARTQWLYPTTRWEEGAVRGMLGGALAAAALACLTTLAGGAVGPGRMQEFGPVFGEVLQHGLVSFGVAGLFAGLVMTGWQRRTLGTGPDVEAEPEPTPVDPVEAAGAEPGAPAQGDGTPARPGQ